MGNGVPSSSRGAVATTVGAPQTQRAAMPMTLRTGRPSWAETMAMSRFDGGSNGGVVMSWILPGRRVRGPRPSSDANSDCIQSDFVAWTSVDDRGRLGRCGGGGQVVDDEEADLARHDVGEAFACLRGDEGLVVPALALGRQRVDLALLGRDGLLQCCDLLALLDRTSAAAGASTMTASTARPIMMSEKPEKRRPRIQPPAAGFTAEGDGGCASSCWFEFRQAEVGMCPLLRSSTQAVKRGNALRPA